MNNTKLVTGYINHLLATEVELPLEMPTREEFDRLARLQAEALENDPYFWAWEDLHDVIYQDPAAGLNILIEIIKKVPKLSLLSSVGAGPLESLLSNSAEAVANEVTTELEKNIRFRYAFAFGNYPDVPSHILQSWVQLFQRLGITKDDVRSQFLAALKAGT